MPKAHPFLKRYRLAEKAAIQELFQTGTFKRFGQFKFKYLTQNATSFRLVISISKRVGNSPARNRLKRLIREAVRLKGNLDEAPMTLAIFINHPLKTGPTLGEVQSLLEQFYQSVEK